jgi:hypothetical protein
MDDPHSRTLLSSEPGRALSSVPNNVPAGEVEQDPLHLAFSLGGDFACVWSNDSVARDIMPKGDGFILPGARSGAVRPVGELDIDGWHAFDAAVQADGLLSAVRHHLGRRSGSGSGSPSGHRSASPSRSADPGSEQPCIYDFTIGSQQRQTQRHTQGPVDAAGDPAREGVVAVAATHQGSGPWKLRRDNSDGTGIPVVWGRECAHGGSQGEGARRRGRAGWCASVLELQLIHGDGSQEIPQGGSSGRSVLGYLYTGAAAEAGESGTKETGPAGEEGPQEQSSISISGIKFQYWLTSRPDPQSDGLNVLLEVLPGFNRHLVQSANGILPGFRYWFLKCDRFQCLVGDPDADAFRDDLPMRASELRRIETIGFLTWLGLDARHYTLHITPAEFRNPPDPWRDWRSPPLTGLDMSWYPR